MHDHEIFELVELNLHFDVKKAHKIIKRKHKSIKRISIKRLTPALEGVEITSSHVKSTDMSKPGIIGSIGNWKFLMDGHHRLSKAKKSKRKYLSYYILTKKETRECAQPKKLYDKLSFGLPFSVQVSE